MQKIKQFVFGVFILFSIQSMVSEPRQVMVSGAISAKLIELTANGTGEPDYLCLTLKNLTNTDLAIVIPGSYIFALADIKITRMMTLLTLSYALEAGETVDYYVQSIALEPNLLPPSLIDTDFSVSTDPELSECLTESVEELLGEDDETLRDSEWFCDNLRVMIWTKMGGRNVNVGDQIDLMDWNDVEKLRLTLRYGRSLRN